MFTHMVNTTKMNILNANEWNKLKRNKQNISLCKTLINYQYILYICKENINSCIYKTLKKVV